MDEKFEREKRDRIFPTSSHRFPYCPILPAISRYFLSAPLLWDKDFQIRSHCVPFLLFPAFGQTLPRRLLADTNWGAVRPAQASSTIDRTHDHIISKSKRLGKRQMSSVYPNAIALGTRGNRALISAAQQFGAEELALPVYRGCFSFCRSFPVISCHSGNSGLAAGSKAGPQGSQAGSVCYPLCT